MYVLLITIQKSVGVFRDYYEFPHPPVAVSSTRLASNKEHPLFVLAEPTDNRKLDFAAMMITIIRTANLVLNIDDIGSDNLQRKHHRTGCGSDNL